MKIENTILAYSDRARCLKSDQRAALAESQYRSLSILERKVMPNDIIACIFYKIDFHSIQGQ